MSKRTELMIAEDRAKVCDLLARGITNRSEMARIINSGRAEEFHISSQQIGKDIKKMQEDYLERGFESLEVYRHQAMNEMLYLIKTLYEGYERSRVSKITLESMRAIDTPDEYDEVMNQPELEQENLEGIHPFNRDAKVKEEYRGEGNPAFLSTIKATLDSLNKIRGIDGATKVALTDPTGTEEFTGIAEMMKARMDELSTREAPTDTDKYLLEAAPEEDAIDAEVTYEED
jgi:hypothetical protein